LGGKAVVSDRRKLYLLLLYVCFALLIWTFRVPMFGMGEGNPFAEIQRAGFENLFRVGFVAGLVGLVWLFGMPFGSKSIHENLQRIGFTNSAGEHPLLVDSMQTRAIPK